MLEINLCQFTFKNESVIHFCDKVVICAIKYTRMNTLKDDMRQWTRGTASRVGPATLPMMLINENQSVWLFSHIWVKLIFKFTTIVRVCLHVVLISWEKTFPSSLHTTCLMKWAWQPAELWTSGSCWLLVGLEMKLPIHCIQELFIRFVPPPMSKCRSVFRCPSMTWWSRCSHYEKEYLSICGSTYPEHQMKCRNVSYCSRWNSLQKMSPDCVVSGWKQ